MELAKGGELFDKLLEEGCLSERVAAKIITQVSRATNVMMIAECRNNPLTGSGGRS